MLKDLIKKLNRSDNTNQIKAFKKSMLLQAALGLGAVVVAVVLIFAATAAWYTNTAKTGTLRFETEAWGYDGDNITVAETDAVIAPGKSGIVPLKIDNSKSPETIVAGVSVLKKQMSSDMQKRIYFYADTSDNIGGETVSRVYIGSAENEGYDYKIFGGDMLTLSELYYNDIPIKWEWVYDTVGYYFKGSVTDMVLEEEYLRPIEYDLDDAVFEQESAANLTRKLLSVNGVSVSDFLAGVSANDGYPGAITSGARVTVGGRDYYRVAVDENGYGVWAYLCTYGEILNNTEIDTQLSQNADECFAKVRITAQAVPMDGVEVADADGLFAALPDADVITFRNDITIDRILRFENGNETIIDLNGYTLYYDVQNLEYPYLVFAQNGGSATFMNGYVACKNAAPAVAFYAEGADLKLCNLTVSGFRRTVQNTDCANGGTELDSSIKIYNCDFSATEAALVIHGNGPKTEAKTPIIVQNSKLYGTVFGIVGNGTSKPGDERWGTSLAVLDSEVTADWVAIYHPQRNSDALVSKSKLQAYTGIVVRGGNMTIADSEVTGTGEYKQATPSGDGNSDTGGAVLLEGGYDWESTIAMSGKNIIISKNGYAVELCGVENKGINKIIIRGGNYSGKLGEFQWNRIGHFDIYSDELKILLKER